MILEQGEYKGYKYVVTSGAGMGFRTAYVQIPQGHPWHKKDYDDCKSADNDWVDCHGGLTYAGSLYDGSIEGWWVGFDAGHLGDWVDHEIIEKEGFLRDGLAMKRWVKTWNRPNPICKGTIKTTEFMSGECKKIIDQAIEVAQPKALNP